MDRVLLTALAYGAAAILLIAGSVMGSTALAGDIRCLVRGRHDAVRTRLGPFRCRSCGGAFSDFDEAGFPDGGYVPELRSMYDRETGGVARTSEWAQSERGGW